MSICGKLPLFFIHGHQWDDSDNIKNAIQKQKIRYRKKKTKFEVELRKEWSRGVEKR